MRNQVCFTPLMRRAPAADFGLRRMTVKIPLTHSGGSSHIHNRLAATTLAAVLNTQPEFRLQVSTNQTAWPDKLMLGKFLCADLCTEAESDRDFLNGLICHLYSVHPVKCLLPLQVSPRLPRGGEGLIPLQLCPEWDYFAWGWGPTGKQERLLLFR